MRNKYENKIINTKRLLDKINNKKYDKGSRPKMKINTIVRTKLGVYKNHILKSYHHHIKRTHISISHVVASLKSYCIIIISLKHIHKHLNPFIYIINNYKAIPFSDDSSTTQNIKKGL